MKKGFTIAEVLVVLGIIGVIAALTIPHILDDTATRTNFTKFRKAHSLLSQSLTTQMAFTNTNINTRNLTDYPNLEDFFAVHMNANDITGSVITTVDGMTFDFSQTGDCTLAKTASATNLGLASSCSVIVDVDGPDNGANAGVSFQGGIAVVRDQFELLIYDSTVAPADGTLEEFLLGGGNDLSKYTPPAVR